MFDNASDVSKIIVREKIAPRILNGRKLLYVYEVAPCDKAGNPSHWSLTQMIDSKEEAVKLAHRLGKRYMVKTYNEFLKARRK